MSTRIYIKKSKKGNFVKTTYTPIRGARKNVKDVVYKSKDGKNGPVRTKTLRITTIKKVIKH